MEFDLFNYTLPEKNIALYPKKRGNSWLLVCFKKSGKCLKTNFSNIFKFLPKNSLLILNNTKVFKARIPFYLKNGKKGELLTIKIKENGFQCLLKPGKKVWKDKEIFFDQNIWGKVVSKDEKGRFLIETEISPEEIIKKFGKPPLPPYIKREIKKIDERYYQTVYAKKIGSIAAPTAGFHFTKNILKKIKDKNIKICYITLHIGEGTFKPIREKEIEKHKMEEEYYEISKKTAKEIEKAKNKGNKIICVGTSVVRALESSFLKGGGKILPTSDFTDLFIYPGFKFNITDLLITNFHLPKSTPLCLASAFAGTKNLKFWYNYAIKKNFRFLSYGDAMLIKD